VLPLLVAPVIDRAVADSSDPVRWVVGTGCLAVWVATLVATFVPSTLSLTVLRVAAPAVPLAGAAASVAGGGGGGGGWGGGGRRGGGGAGGEVRKPGGGPGGAGPREGQGVRGRLVVRRRAPPAATHAD